MSADPLPIKRVALIVETTIAPRRLMLTGVARYMQEHRPWAVYLKPEAVEKSIQNWLETWTGDGIIAALNDLAADAILNVGVPVVDVAGFVRRPGVPLVRTNDISVGRLGAEHLMERGFQQFGFCAYTDQFWSVRRREGFEAALAEKGLACHRYEMPRPTAGSGGPAFYEQQQRSLADWLAGLPKPVGIMATNDVFGQQVLEACQRLRISVPEVVAVVGADDDEPICRIAMPPLSSVIINDHQRGFEAAAVLDRMMDGHPPPEGPVYVEPAGVRARASTDILAIDDDIVASALRILRQRACDGIGVDDLVRQVHVSRSVLERRFRKAVGRSINEEIVRVRLNRAVELLTDTTLTIKAVADKAGFGTQIYMNAVFKTKLGRTPGSYRNAQGK
ncbi:MAG: DNA-binding transcriptional regulator [Tepidisphaeraceae bacterium]